MLIQSYSMYLLNSVAVYDSPRYRQCRPAPVSSNQESSRAIPRKSVGSKHKSRIWFDMLLQSYSVITIKQCSCVELTQL